MSQRDAGPLRKDRRSWVARGVALIGLLLLGGVASLALLERGNHDADRREHELTLQVAAGVRAAGEQVRTALAGSAGLVNADGSVDPASFAAFARSVLATGAVEAVAYEPKVTGDQRAAFEALHGFFGPENHPVALAGQVQDFRVSRAQLHEPIQHSFRFGDLKPRP